MNTPSLAPVAFGTLQQPKVTGREGFYVTGEDHLRLRTFNSAAGVELALECRFLDLNGRVTPYSERHVPNTDRTVATTIHSLAEGWLLDARLRATVGTPRQGQCFAILEVIRGRTGAVQPLATIWQGYVTDTTPLGWPGAPSRASVDGPGIIRSITGTDPAAGAEFSETVPTNARWRLLGVIATFVTDATVANRGVVLVIDDGANIVAEIAPAALQSALTTVIYSYALGVQGLSSGTGRNNAPLPDALMLAGYRVRSVSVNGQAGDNFGAPRLWAEEWIED